MTFDDFWMRQQYATSADDYEFAKAAWDAAIDACIEAATKEADDWTVLRDIAKARMESSLIEATNILAVNRCAEAIGLMRSNVMSTTKREVNRILD